MSIDSIPHLGPQTQPIDQNVTTAKMMELNNMLTAEMEQANINFRRKVFLEIIQPEYENDIRDTLQLRNCWSKTSNVFFTLSSILIGVTTLLSFANGQFKTDYLNYIAGSVGIVAILCERFGAYAKTNDHNTTLKINEILKNVGVTHTFVDTSKYDAPADTTHISSPQDLQIMPKTIDGTNRPRSIVRKINKSDVVINMPKK